MTHRCPLGRCLLASQVCDLLPDCQDSSDEKKELCDALEPPTCSVAEEEGEHNREGECVCEKDSQFRKVAEFEISLQLKSPEFVQSQLEISHILEISHKAFALALLLQHQYSIHMYGKN